jgi:YaiO family outer membrane protein
MRRQRCAAALLAALAAAFAAASAQAADNAAQRVSTSVRASTAIEHLDNGSPDWRENTAGLQFGFAPREVLDLSAGETRRFGLRDSQFGAGFSMPLSPSLSATIDANASATHQVLARHALGAELQYEFAHAWLVHGGARSSSFDSATVNQGLLALEHYFADYSVTLGWRPARAFGQAANGVELRASRYYGERDAITLIVAGGQEAASIPGGVALTKVRSAALTGRHWLDRHWAVSYALGHTRQGSLYARNGFTLGAQYAF